MSINGTIGKIAYYTGEKIILGKSAAYFEVMEENTVCNKYLYYYLQSKKALQYFENNKTGSTIKNLGIITLLFISNNPHTFVTLNFPFL